MRQYSAASGPTASTMTTTGFAPTTAAAATAGRIQSFGAEVELGRKTRHEKFRVFDREDLLCTAQIVNVAFDIEARKAIVIPEDHRAELEKRCHPDLL